MKSTIAQLAVFGLFSLSLHAQEGKEARADKKFDKYAYVDAIKTYERIAEKGYKNSEMLQKLGDSYYFNAKYAEAAKWYGELIALGDAPAEYYYRYAQSLRSTGDSAKADQMMEKFKTANSGDSRAAILNKNKDFRAAIEKNSGRYNLEDAGVNSSASDYGAAVRNNELYFTTARDTGNFAKRIHTWDGNYLTNFYTAEINEDGSLNGAKKLKSDVKTRFHESTASFSPDGNTMYFTRNNFNEGKRGRNENRATLLKIYAATWKDSSWTDVRELPFNDNNFNTAHPSVSADGQWMYFASDREGGFGGSDLYKVAIGADNTFGAPINLGSAINTAGRETFPFISKANELYFSTDGHPGLGGLDIFYAKAEEDGNFGEAFNIGAPANSTADDFGFYIDSDSKKGFLSSNREGGQGSDDIYKFIELKEIETKKEVKLIGNVEDLVSTEAVPNAVIILQDENFNEVRRVTADENGKFDLGVVEAGKKYYVKVEADNYNTNEQPIIISKEKDVTELRIQMEKTVTPIKPGDNLADAFNIKIIYFDFDKSDIRSDAAIDLAKIIDVMEQHPTMKVDVQSHTDSRGSKAYNRKLSDRRVKSTMDWMKKNGIKADRLTGKGYGESQLVNRCADDVECSEEEHQANRRSLFIITEL